MSFEEGNDDIITTNFERSILSNVQNNILVWSSKLSCADKTHAHKTPKEGPSPVPRGFLKRGDSARTLVKSSWRIGRNRRREREEPS